MDIYKNNGFNSRQEYLDHLSEEYGIPQEEISMLADLLGESEDFDGLVSQLEGGWY